MSLTIDQIDEALRVTGGFVTHAAKKLNVTYQALYMRIKKSEQLQNTLEEMQESYLDLSESQLIKNVQNGKEASLFFYLKCKGKGRGYVEKQQFEHTGKDGEPIKNSIQIEFVKPTDNK